MSSSRKYSNNYYSVISRFYRKKAKLLGKCPICRTGDPEPNKANCRECLDDIANQNRIRYYNRIKNGLCTDCGLARDDQYQWCSKCRKKNNDRRNARIDRNRAEYKNITGRNIPRESATTAFVQSVKRQG